MAQHVVDGFGDLGTVARAQAGVATQPVRQGGVGRVGPLQDLAQHALHLVDAAGGVRQARTVELRLLRGRVALAMAFAALGTVGTAFAITAFAAVRIEGTAFAATAFATRGTVRRTRIRAALAFAAVRICLLYTSRCV